MSTRNQRVGQWGEQAAAVYLQERGYAIRGRNVRTPYGEIDLVVEKDGLIVFTEVKTRTTHSYGPPEISVTPRKQAHMLAAAEHYAAKNEIDHWRIDVIAVDAGQRDEPEIIHFENAVG
jgi:putative endonuclease